jgi:hypothetical protein
MDHETIGRMMGLLALLMIAGCGASGTLTPEQRAYLDRAGDMPLVFNLSPADAGPAWSRAVDFVSHYAGLPVKIAGESLIETEAPREGRTSLGYRIRQSTLGDSIRMTIEPLRPPSSTASTAELAGDRLERPRDARMLALYMRTGELRPELIEH